MLERLIVKIRAILVHKIWVFTDYNLKFWKYIYIPISYVNLNTYIFMNKYGDDEE
jgi:hypothetical protein